MSRKASRKYWICKECDFRNNKALSPAECIFCSNKWKCTNCNFFNNIKNYHCTLCESEWDSLSSSDYECFDNNDDHEYDEEFSDNNQALPKYRVQVPLILIPSEHNKLEIKTNKITVNEVKDHQYQIKLLDVVNSLY
eukprot:UN01642